MTDEHYSLGMLKEIRSAYTQYCAEHGKPEIWAQRAEVFEGLIDTAIALRECNCGRELSRGQCRICDNDE